MPIRFAPTTLAAITAAGSVLVVPATASVAAHTGVYHGTVRGIPVTPCKTNEGEGFFRAKRRANGTLKMVPPRSFTFTEGPAACHGPAKVDTIVAPSDFKCNAVNANLPVKSVSIKSGSFDWSGNAPIGPGGAKRHVRFKGHWVAPNKVKGYTRIQGSGCDSGKLYWTMRKL